jgi:hypothetical protein
MMARPTRGRQPQHQGRTHSHNTEADNAVRARVVIIRDQRRAVEAPPGAHADYSRRFVASEADEARQREGEKALRCLRIKLGAAEFPLEVRWTRAASPRLSTPRHKLSLC